ncbi:MAG: polysaccharide deacetylase family protein [Lachnospiraceae bacterium]|nr:polysaccharide deacetylase family protein [Lachnospiraceae bacterium]
MVEYLKKTGVILGHIVCIIVLLICFTDKQKLFSEQEGLTPTPTVMPTAEPTSTPMPTVTPTPEPTSTPMPTVTPTPEPTSTPTPTVTPTPEPTSTPTPTVTPTPEPTSTPIPTVEPVNERAIVKNGVLQKIAEGEYASLNNEKDNWWFKRKENHVPSGSGENFKISNYLGFYRNSKVTNEDKVIYITIDCGYDSPNTMVMLDIFKKHEIKVTFFLTKFFMEDSPKEIKRMVEEGHSVANHSVSHKDLTALTDQEIYQEIVKCEELFHEMTGADMTLAFRPPEGAYSKRTMQITKDLGYKTFFWSIAYFDYDKRNQPGKQYVLDHFATYHHNGAIALMHNDSDSNMEAMDELITYLKEQGYRFGTLDELE